MTFLAKIQCDGRNCSSEKQLNATHPSDAETEFYQCNWVHDSESDASYCPKCKQAALNEIFARKDT